MTPAGFATLGLRLLSLYVLSVVFGLLVGEGQQAWQQYTGSVSDRFIEMLAATLGQAAGLAVVAWFLWFKAGGLAKRLLPSGANPDAGAGYAAWQRIGLMFAGGLIALQALGQIMRGLNSYPTAYFVGGLMEMAFAVVLIVGASELSGVLARVLSGRWRSAVGTARD